MLNAVLLLVLWSVIAAPFVIVWREDREARRDAASVVRFSEARKAMAPGGDRG